MFVKGENAVHVLSAPSPAATASPNATSGVSGIAHFLEHLMFKGTAKHPAGEFSQTVLRIGGNENAFTSLDFVDADLEMIGGPGHRTRHDFASTRR